ncbi:MAG: DUF3575 domain-containing protein [Ginsengibacter sp.]
MQLIKNLAIGSMLLSHFFAISQSKEKNWSGDKKNVVKLNFSALAIKNISLQYERQVSHKSSVALNVHALPFGKAPFRSIIKNIVDNQDAKIDQLKVGIFGVAPEYRFYLGKNGAFHGLYLGPFISYNSYKTDLPISYDYGSGTNTGIFSGKINAYTAGLQLGAQWKLSKSIFLDWWIIGPNIGTGSGKSVYTSNLSYLEQAGLSIELQQLKDDVPYHLIKSYSVGPEGAVINIKGPWAGVRGLGFNFGFNF